MDAQHQKTNKSAQFACYLREHTSSSSITSYVIFSRCCFPPHPFVPLPIQRIQAGLPGKQAKQQREGEVFGDDLFFFLFFGHGNKRLRQELSYLPALPYHEPATANRRTVNCDLETKTTMCDYTKVEYACYHLRYTVRAWCKSTYFSGHPFLFLFSFLFLFLFFLFLLFFFFFLFAPISQCPRHG